MSENDASYFHRRALQEQVAADKATCEAARQRHDELAVMYQFRAAILSKRLTCSNEVIARELQPDAA